MDSERWQRIETLFDAALDLDPSRWDTFLDDHCRDDPALRAEVAALLAAHVPPAEPTAVPGKRGTLARLARRRNAIIAGALLLTIAALATALRVNLSRKTDAIQRGLTLEEEARVARTEAYVSALAAAEASIRTHQIDDARILLERTPPELRGWEWRHLSRRLDRSLFSIPAHARDVTGIAFAHNGSHFVTSSLDGTIGFWRAESGDSLRRAGPFVSGVESIAIHPSDTTVALGLGDGTVVLYDPVRGAERARLAGRKRAQVAFHPDGSRLAAAFNDGTITEWRLDTLQPTGTINAGGASLCVTYSRDGNQLITGDDAGHAKVWDARTRRRIADVKAHERRITDIAAGDEGVFATASQDRAVKVWRIADRRLLIAFDGHDGAVTAVAFMPGGAEVVSAGTDRRILRWSVATGSVATEIHAGDTARAIAVDPAGERIAAGEAGVVRVWPRNAEDVRTFRTAADSLGQAGLYDACLSRDGSLLAGAPNRLEVDLWDAASGAHLARIGTGRADVPTRVAFNPGGTHLYAGDRGGNVIVFDTARRRRLFAFAAHSAAVQGLGVSPDGAVLVSASADSTMKFWDARTLAPRGEVHGLSGAVTKIVFSPAGTLATACSDRAIRLWSAASGDTLRVIRGQGAAVVDLAFSPDGARLVAVTADGAVRLLNAATGATLGTMETVRAGAACYTPDGGRIVIGGVDPVVRIFNPDSKLEVARLHGHSGRILSLAATPTGNAIISTSGDATIRIWDAR